MIMLDSHSHDPTSPLISSYPRPSLYATSKPYIHTKTNVMSRWETAKYKIKLTVEGQAGALVSHTPERTLFPALVVH